MGTVNTPEITDDHFITSSLLEITADVDEQPVSAELTHAHPTTQMLLTSKPPIHMPEAGLNPLVDAAAYIFSIMGKLSYTKHHNNLEKLHSELMLEIEDFRDTVHTYSYKAEYLAEYLLISRYAMCATLDNIITNTVWGGEGKWDAFSLVKTNNLTSLSHENVLIILERLVSEPDVYIDVMEFMYICLSFGLTFKQNSKTSAFTHEQLEQITCSLYRRIRAYRGSYSKILSPFSIKPPASSHSHTASKGMSKWLKVLFVVSLLAATFAGGKYWIDHLDNQGSNDSNQVELNIE